MYDQKLSNHDEYRGYFGKEGKLRGFRRRRLAYINVDIHARNLSNTRSLGSIMINPCSLVGVCTYRNLRLGTATCQYVQISLS